MRVAVIGATGQVGRDVVKAFEEKGHNVAEFGHELEVADGFATNMALGVVAPEAVINCAAMHTAPCEKDPAKAYLVNAIGARNVAQYCRGTDALMVQISTDQVFDGIQTCAYTEFSPANPRTVYGSTKLAGEYFVKTICPRNLILRTTCLFGVNPTRGKVGGFNFVDMMLEKSKLGTVSVVDDEYTTPTSTESLAKQIALLAETDRTGVFHAVGQGRCSWNQFAREIFYQTDIECDVKVPTANPSGFERAKNLVMSNDRLDRLHLSVMQPWQLELKQYLTRKGLWKK